MSGRRRPRRPAATEGGGARRWWALRLLRNLVLWLVPLAALWVLATPLYNRFLAEAGENLVRLGERPAVTRLPVEPPHHALVVRTDLPGRRAAGSIRLTDLHFPAVLLAAMCLAVPGVAWRRRLGALAWGLLLLAVFHAVSVLLWVKFVYATGLGAWSLAHYGPVAREAWGLAKHLADLPFKLGLPLALWAAFFLDELLRGRRDDGPSPTSGG